MSVSRSESLSLFIVCSFLTDKEVCCSKFSLNCLLYSLGLGSQWYKSPGCFHFCIHTLTHEVSLGFCFAFFLYSKNKAMKLTFFQQHDHFLKCNSLALTVQHPLEKIDPLDQVYSHILYF